ncbi:hypothetical protein ACLMAB_25370 [Brevibacillus laterosporus]
MPMSLMMVLLSSMAGRWISKSGKYKRYAIFGIFFMILGMLLMGFMNSIALAVVSMCLFGLGLGLGMPVFTLAAQNAVPLNQLGVVTATATLFRNLGGTIGIAVFGSIMNSILKRKLEETIASGEGLNLSQLDPQQAEQLVPFLNPQVLLDQPKLKVIEATLPEGLQLYFAQMMDMLRSVLSDTLSTVFFTGAGILVVALVLVFFLKEIPLRSADKGTSQQES